MTAPSESFAFFLVRGSHELTVDVSREIVEDAIGAERVTMETQAQWIQENMGRLIEVAERKIPALGWAGSRIVISSEDAWW